MSKIAFLFPGQGAQMVGMGRQVAEQLPAARRLYQRASEVVGYDQDESGVRVRLASGERIAGAALIGADGLWSNVRKQMVADGPPRVSGHTTYRSVIPTDRMAESLRWNAATLWAGPAIACTWLGSSTAIGPKYPRYSPRLASASET